MFKLLYLKLNGHRELGDVELRFVEDVEVNNNEKPYTTVIIGPNGTGKSFIQRTIADVFRQFNDYKESEKKQFNLPFTLHLRYMYNRDIYEIVTKKLRVNGKKREYLYFKNRPIDIPITEIGNQSEDVAVYQVQLQDLRFPDNIIVSSILLNDRFTFANSKSEDFYQYLGVRRTRSVTSTSSFPRKTVRFLFDSSNSSEFLPNLEKMLDFMEFEKHFVVQYKKRYKKILFTGKLKPDKFEELFTKWWEVTRRKKNNPPYSAPVYKKLKEHSPEKIESIIKFINSLVDDSKEKKVNNKSNLLEIDLFEPNTKRINIELIEELVKLDILSLEEIQIRKKNVEFSIEQSSSGESHLILTLLGLYSKVKPGSLVLIDEPEVSLHPNWQMKYIQFLKEMFRGFPGCHFILTTHSHFIVSDLEGDNSSIISLSRDEETNIINAKLLEGNTYGWSAEEVLYSVFSVRSTRNSYLEYDLTKLISLLNQGSTDYAEIRRILNKTQALVLNENDPLLIIKEKTEKYLRDSNA